MKQVIRAIGAVITPLLYIVVCYAVGRQIEAMTVLSKWEGMSICVFVTALWPILLKSLLRNQED